MKADNYPIFRQIFTLGAFAVMVALVSTNTQAATVAGGTLTLNLDRNAVIAGVIKDNYPDTPTANFPICCRPSLYVEEFFDASAASKAFFELRDYNTPNLYDLESDEISAVGLQYSVNGSIIALNPSGRENRATTYLAQQPAA